MVADKIREIYLAEGTEQKFNFPKVYLKTLKPDVDAPLFRLLIDILLDGVRKGHDCPENLEDHVYELMSLRLAGWSGSRDLHLGDSEAVCRDYHSHSHGLHCHKALDRKHDTKGLTKDIFSQIKRNTLRYIDR
jgi:hypothetical protein